MDVEDSNKRSNHQLNNLAPLAVGDQKLERHIGYFSGTAMNVGEMIGSGIFSNPSFILKNTGSGGMMLLLWLIGSLSTICGLLTFLELGTMFPRSGGEKAYLGCIYPNPRQLASFLFMILVGVCSRCGAIAQASIVFGDNMMYAINGEKHSNEWHSRGFGVACITFWIVVNILSAKTSIIFNNLFTGLKILLLLLLICVGFAGMAGVLPNQPPLSENFSFQGTVQSPGSYANATYFVIFSYGGYYNLQRVTDELKNPLVNLPRCGATSIIFVTMVYILANCAYLSVLSVDVIKSSQVTVAASLFNTAFGGIFGSRILPVFVGLSSFGMVGVVVYSASRVILEFAREGHLPFDRFFSKVHPVLQTPVRAIFLLYLLSLAFLLGPPAGAVFEFIMSFNTYGDYVFAILCAIGLILLRYREPDLRRPIRAPKVAVLFFITTCIFILVFVYIPPLRAPEAYPYYVPYIFWLVFALLCTIPWYIKMVLYNGLENSYNHEIRHQATQGQCISDESNDTYVVGTVNDTLK